MSSSPLNGRGKVVMSKVDKAALEEAYINTSAAFEAMTSRDVWYHEGSVLQIIKDF